MGRNPLPLGERKVSVTIRLKSKTLEKLKKYPNYNLIIQKLVEEELERRENSNNDL